MLLNTFMTLVILIWIAMLSTKRGWSTEFVMFIHSIVFVQHNSSALLQKCSANRDAFCCACHNRPRCVTVEDWKASHLDSGSHTAPPENGHVGSEETISRSQFESSV